MKIHVVTYLHNNYGSILQAFALQSKLAELGAEPDLLIEKQTENHSSFLKILNFLRPKSNYSFFLRMKIRAQRRKFDAKIRKITEFKKRHFKILKLENFSFQLSNSDILIAGSDQIWSVLNGELSDWYTLRWCADSCIKKYSYAASLGYVGISAEQKEQFKTKLSDFVTISFREEQAAALFYDDFKGRVRCDIDPTLLYDGGFWKNLVSNNIRKKKYIFLYVLRPNDALINLAGRIGKKHDLEVIYIGQTADNYKNITTICDAGIEDFLSYIYHAEAVITNSFHGTVFSILFHKKFASIKIDSTSSRVENLLQKVKLMDHMIANLNNVETIINENIQYDEIDDKLEEYRKASIDYLTDIMQVEVIDND